MYLFIYNISNDTVNPLYAEGLTVRLIRDLVKFMSHPIILQKGKCQIELHFVIDGRCLKEAHY